MRLRLAVTAAVLALVAGGGVIAITRVAAPPRPPRASSSGEAARPGPLRVAVAWLAAKDGLRADVTTSSPLADIAPVAAALRAAGAVVDPPSRGGAITGRWVGVVPGQTLRVSISPGLRSTSGATLADALEADYTVPAARPASTVQLSGEGPLGPVHDLRLHVYYVATATARADLARHIRQVDVLSPSFYSLDGDGGLHVNIDAAALATARAAGVAVMPLVTNRDFDSQVAHDLVTGAGKADLVASRLIDEATRRGYTGYQLDFENMNLSDRDDLTAFSSRLAAALGKARLQYSVAVVPKKSPDRSGLGALFDLRPVYDYAALSTGSAWLTLMAYDEHARAVDPGPVAGIDWVRGVVQASVDGVDRSRVYLGVPLYSRDWSGAGGAVSGAYADAIDAAVANNAGIEWDFDAGGPAVRYSSADADHVTWFDNRQSLEEKIRLARELKLAGVSTWRLGFEDPGFWDLWPEK